MDSGLSRSRVSLRPVSHQPVLFRNWRCSSHCFCLVARVDICLCLSVRACITFQILEFARFYIWISLWVIKSLPALTRFSVLLSFFCVRPFTAANSLNTCFLPVPFHHVSNCLPAGFWMLALTYLHVSSSEPVYWIFELLLSLGTSSHPLLNLKSHPLSLSLFGSHRWFFIFLGVDISFDTSGDCKNLTNSPDW